MSADPRINPVADVQSAIRPHRDVGRPEHRGNRPRDTGRTHHEVRPRVLALRIRCQKDLLLQAEAGALTRRLIREHFVASGIGGEERAFPSGPERAVLVEHISGRRPAAIHVASRRHARIVLAPLGYRDRLTRPPIGLPRALAVDRREPEIGVLHDPAHPAGGRVVVVVLKHVAERGH